MLSCHECIREEQPITQANDSSTSTFLKTRKISTDTSYLFLGRTLNKYLLTIGNNGDLDDVERLINGSMFVHDAQLIKRLIDLRGFGIFERGTYNPSEIAKLRNIYKTASLPKENSFSLWEPTIGNAVKQCRGQALLPPRWLAMRV
ncbi:hypothetical protein MRX96_003050 [Rhipicephalus microplus]